MLCIKKNPYYPSEIWTPLCRNSIQADKCFKPLLSTCTGVLISPKPDKLIFIRMARIYFGALPCRKTKLMTARVSMLLISRASLTCFRACFLPGWAKDLSTPRVRRISVKYADHYVNTKAESVFLLTLQILTNTAFRILHRQHGLVVTTYYSVYLLNTNH